MIELQMTEAQKKRMRRYQQEIDRQCRKNGGPGGAIFAQVYPVPGIINCSMLSKMEALQIIGLRLKQKKARRMQCRR